MNPKEILNINKKKLCDNCLVFWWFMSYYGIWEVNIEFFIWFFKKEIKLLDIVIYSIFWYNFENNIYYSFRFNLCGT